MISPSVFACSASRSSPSVRRSSTGRRARGVDGGAPRRRLVLDRALARRARASLAHRALRAGRAAHPPTARLAHPHRGRPGVATFLAPLTLRDVRPRRRAEHLADVPRGMRSPRSSTPPPRRCSRARAVVARVRLARPRRRSPRAMTNPGVPCPIVEHDELGPMAVGLLAPRIVLPRRLLAPGEESALACVLRHEAAHLRRRDAWLSAAMELLASWRGPSSRCGSPSRASASSWSSRATRPPSPEPTRPSAAATATRSSTWPSAPSRSSGRAVRRRRAALRLHAAHSHRGARSAAPLAARAQALPSARPLALLVACPAPGRPTRGSEIRTMATSSRPTRRRPAPRLRRRLPPRSPSMPAASPPRRFRLPCARTSARFRPATRPVSRRIGADRHRRGEIRVRRRRDHEGGGPRQADDLPDKDVGLCVVGEFMKVTYPKAKAGVATVVYPIQFAPCFSTPLPCRRASVVPLQGVKTAKIN